ncbi:leucine-rich repeat domain-containing protein [Algoriphagus namhaensis]
MIKSKFILAIAFLCMTPISLMGQTIKGYTKEEIKEFSEKVEDQVRFLEYLLNTIGGEDTPARDKDVVIRESYLKIFRDGQVQVEDDLLMDRKVVTNKDVTAYLKDIEFFFKKADFKFKVREVKPSQKENGEVFFLVSLDRTLTATQNSGKEITDTKLRYIEVNLEEKSQELKIASIYTTKLSRDEELTEWWELLNPHWQDYFRTRFQINPFDSVDLDLIYRFVSVDSVDISGTDSLLDLTPLQALRELKYVDLSNTQVTALGPISNVTFLESLDISDTPAKDIQFIKYSDRLKYLDISNTQVTDISELSNLAALEELKASGTPVMSFAVVNDFTNLKRLYLPSSGFNNAENIKDLNQLEVLDISNNYLINFSQLQELSNLKYLNLAGTNIQDLSPLQNMDKLEEVDLTGTEISDLSALSAKPALIKILADETKLSEIAADNFIRANPSILLIHHVKNLTTWWEKLSEAWKQALIDNNPRLSAQPGIEVLTQTIGLEELDLRAKGITTLTPLTRFAKLRRVDFSENEITDLLPLSEVMTLEELVGENTGVSSLDPISNNENIKRITLNGSPVESILPILSLPQLELIAVNDGKFFEEEVPEVLIQRPKLVIIYRSDALATWWEGLSTDWKSNLAKIFELSDSPDEVDLHRMTGVSRLSFTKSGISDLTPIQKFINLRSLEIFDAPLITITPIAELKHLKNLKLSQMPVTDFSPISQFFTLETLDISNTGIEDLEPLAGLSQLLVLNLSGTNLKNLKGLESLVSLQELDVASTNLRSLRPIEDLNNLKKLVCFNTRLSSRAVDSFREKMPDCEVRYY